MPPITMDSIHDRDKLVKLRRSTEVSWSTKPEPRCAKHTVRQRVFKFFSKTFKSLVLLYRQGYHIAVPEKKKKKIKNNDNNNKKKTKQNQKKKKNM